MKVRYICILTRSTISILTNCVTGVAAYGARGVVAVTAKRYTPMAGAAADPEVCHEVCEEKCPSLPESVIHC